MKKFALSVILSIALATGGMAPANAGTNGRPPPSSGSNSDGVVIAVILVLGAIIFGGSGSRSRTTKTVKPADSDF